ncbi:MAG: PIN domain-containing protein [Spirochaetes bacterium]|nr:PIN domain-containing protein [Spirochaetota bacterium]
MIVDTSVWIDFFNGVQNGQSEYLADSIESDKTIFMHSIILMEILRGFRSEKDHSEVKDILLSYNFVTEDPVQEVIGASDLYRSLKKKGATIRKSMDCLIAYAAIKNGLPLLHRDRDFDIIAKHSKLKLIVL